MGATLATSHASENKPIVSEESNISSKGEEYNSLHLNHFRRSTRCIFNLFGGSIFPDPQEFPGFEFLGYCNSSELITDLNANEGSLQGRTGWD